MKFTAYKSIMAVALATVFVACDPLDEVYDEIPAINDNTISAEMELTLTDDDYELLEDVPGGSGPAQYGNFDHPDEPREFIPYILDARFPHLGKGSSAKVTYHYYNGSSPYLSDDLGDVTVSDQEYDDLGYRYGNFDNLEADLPKYAAYKFPNASRGAYVDVTHDYYNGGYTERDVESRVVLTGPYGWMYTYMIPSDAYQDFFQEPFSNFSNTDEAEAKIPAYLPQMLPFAEEGDAVLIGYVYYDDGVQDDVAHFTLSNGTWVLYGDGFQITEETLSFGHDGSDWVPDNTIRYDFSSADYATVAAEYAGTPWGDNLGTYGNFNRTGGGTSWDDDTMLEAIAYVLANGDFINEEGQKYVVTVVVYNGATATEDWSLIYEGGEWVLNSAE
ncbi:hypothetical protein BXY85_2227 [Roseivirga pacifica]|uniref:DUF5017 domain-containing protein n=1 Tax=Roseivirga pacifica TaxID=1267423 RepID=A0A1I0NHZ5_9BACT|nr:hypothetical protein [Roseivirga pacifica]RKQ51205.1 hypothetical protein BXY85_2227 [Roseivirga pacifica]SEW00934.1 hypothetical protein SAMN05216290_1209 [Roseivirga pacifica]